MLIAQFRVNAIPGVEQDVKEVLAMSCEALGKVNVSDIENTDSGMVLTLKIAAPDGSVQVFKKHIAAHLRQFRDTQLLSLREVLPEQIKFTGGMEL